MAIAIAEHEGTSPALTAYLHYLRFVAMDQHLFDQAYPLPCRRCGSKDRRTVDRDEALWWYCAACGEDEGAAIASPVQMAARRVRNLPVGDQPSARRALSALRVGGR